MHPIFEELQRLYLLDGQEWHQQVVDGTGEARYYPCGLLTENVLHAILGGKETAAINLVNAVGMTRTLVFDFDRGEDWPLVEKLSSVLTEELALPEPGISVSGRKGFGLWISLAAPVPVSQARAFLRALRARYLGDAKVDLRPDVDAPTLAGEAVIKLPPCLHRGNGRWSGFIDLGECEDFAEEPWFDDVPDFSEQLARLGNLENTQVSDFQQALKKFSKSIVTEQSAEARFYPHLGKLPANLLPPCVAALVSEGVPNDWNYNTANLNLAAFCKSRCLDQVKSKILAEQMAENTAEDHPTGKKTLAQKLSNFRSNRTPPLFSCDYPRKTAPWRKLFGGERICQDCPANPGFSEPVIEETTNVLETTVANALLTHSWARKEALPPLGVVLPRVEVKIDSRAFQVPFYELAAEAIGAGATSAAFFSGLDRWIRSGGLWVEASGFKKAAAHFLTAIVGGSVSETEGKAARSRALELWKRTKLLELARETVAQCPDTSANVLAMKLRNVADETLRADSASGALFKHRSSLYQALSRDHGTETIPTPHLRLNGLLGGGFRGGRMYVLIAPPKTGKTTLAAVWMDHAAAHGFPVLYVGYEMGRDQMTVYALARKCQLNAHRIEMRYLWRDEAERVAIALDDYLANEGQHLELWEAGLTTSVADMVAWATTAKANYPRKSPLIVVDYLQLAQTGIPEIDAHPSETKRVGAIAVACKDLARQTGAVVIALSSVTKEAERMSKTEGELDVTAARDSLAIIHAADGVFTLQTAMVSVMQKGEKVEFDPWQYLLQNDKDPDLGKALEELGPSYPQKWNIGPDYSIRARLTLARHRGRTGEIALYYRRAYHDLQEVNLPGVNIPMVNDEQCIEAAEIFKKYENASTMKAAPEIETIPPPKVYYKNITDLAEARWEIQRLKGVTGLHFEAIDGSPHGVLAKTLWLYDGTHPALAIDLVSIQGLHHLRAELETLQVIAHDAVLEMRFLWRSGIRINLESVFLAYHVLRGEKADLETLVPLYLGEGTLEEIQDRYPSVNAMAVLALFPKVVEDLTEQNSFGAYELVRNAQGAIVAAYLAGVPFQTDRMLKLIEDWTAKKEALQEKLGKWMPDVNLSSSAQLSQWLTHQLGGKESESWKTWPKTSSGKSLKTGNEELTRGIIALPIEAAAVVRDWLLPFKKLEAKLQTLNTSLLSYVHTETGRIHAEIHLAGTITGRMSCSNPNLQGIPREKEIRSLFVPKAGRVFVIADYGQIELRVAAEIAQEVALLEAFREGLDPHRQTAALILNKSENHVTKEERQLAKAVNFGLLYGQGARGLKNYAENVYRVTLSDKEAQEYRASWFKAYPAFQRWQQEIGTTAKETLEIRTPAGRLRCWDSVEVFKETEAYNTPIQAGAAEAILASLPRLMNRISGTSIVPILVVHDEILLECDLEEADFAKKALLESMIEGMLFIFPNAPTIQLVEAKIVNSWAEK